MAWLAVSTLIGVYLFHDLLAVKTCCCECSRCLDEFVWQWCHVSCLNKGNLVEETKASRHVLGPFVCFAEIAMVALDDQ